MYNKNLFLFQNKNEKNCLYCFYHAGGSVFAFRNWIKFFDNTQVIPVDIHELKEKSNVHLIDIINNVTEAIRLDISHNKKVFIYGHSFGALIAFLVTYQLEIKFAYKINKLFVSGRQSPMEKNAMDSRCSQDINILYEKLKQEALIEKKVLEDEIFIKHFLPSIFKDYQLNEEYHYTGEMIDLPIVTLSGTMDYDASVNIMKRWNNVTTKGITQYEFKGKHFFPYGESQRDVLEVIGMEIEDAK